MGPRALLVCRTGSRLRGWHTQAGENLGAWGLLPQARACATLQACGIQPCLLLCQESMFCLSLLPLMVTGEHLGNGKTEELGLAYSSRFLSFLSQHQHSKQK